MLLSDHSSWHERRRQLSDVTNERVTTHLLQSLVQYRGANVVSVKFHNYCI